MAESESKILCLNFNQDCTCIAVGTDEGFKIFFLSDPKSPFRLCYEKKEGGMRIVTMLYCTSLLGIVGSGKEAFLSPRRLQLYNSSEEKSICELNFTDSILNVKLNKKRLVVVLETKLHIFDVTTMKVLQTVETPPNPKGLVGLSLGNDDDVSFVAYPWSSENSAGDVIVIDAINLHKVCVLKVCKTALSCITFSNDGSLLATTSSKGTIIRVFSVPEGRLLYTLRRGSAAANIYSLGFSPSNSLLSVSSDKGTIHIYKLTDQKKGSADGRQVGSLQDTLSNMWDSVRDFANIKVRSDSGVAKNICVIPNDSTVLVATYDGFLYQYALDPVIGGACRLEKELRLMDPSHVATMGGIGGAVAGEGA
eukprot:TRINITY_DN13230_c0_g1_i1.p1 TRINITY_DN13230_c0_g1~~TRINITY_DN13230_c0_g1_i1.p1  ORF type:complete len:365 (-),score=23.95 TRINITY_DN13230_c0_g1_i1:205-1299(-)